MTDVKEQLRVYFDEVDPPFDPSELMQDPKPVLPPRRGVVRSGVLVAAAAAAVLVLVVGLPLLFVANQPQDAVEPSATTTTYAPTSTTEPATTTTAPDQASDSLPEPPVGVFSWSADDISEWVTNDEITAVLADLSIEYAGTYLDSDAEFELVERPAPVDHELVIGGAFNQAMWTVGREHGDNYWQVGVHNGDHIADNRWFSEVSLSLPEGAINNEGSWGVFAVRGPNSDESFCIWLGAPTEIFGTYVEEDIYLEMISAVASMMLEELGWVD